MSLTPNYLSLDFDTIKNDIINKLKQTDTFKDYNFEGSNISVLIELISYLGELNTYYMNKISKNLYFDTVELYENVHRLTELTGYSPIGYVSSSTDLTITLNQSYSGQYFSYGDILAVYKYKKFKAETISGVVNFLTVKDNTFTVDTSFTDAGETDNILTYNFDVEVKEGTLNTLNYYGSDIFNNKIILPFKKYDHSFFLDEEKTIWLTVNNNQWQRVNNFFENISGIDNEYNMFKLSFDKYRQYSVEFSPNLNIPQTTDEIQIQTIVNDGANGNVAANTITKEPEEQNIVYNVTTQQWIPYDSILVNNTLASVGGTDPEDIDELKNKGKNYINTQFRCITKQDYKNYLERFDSVLKAYAWGQQELRYQSDVRDYNKVYITLIPRDWDVNTINTSTDRWVLDNGKSIDIIVPQSFIPDFKNNLELYLEPYKMMSIYHSYELPELVYFAFDIDISIYGNYNINSVINDVNEKLTYIFRPENRNFGELIDYREVESNIIETGIYSNTNKFNNIKGIKYLRIKDIHTSVDIEEPNNKQVYPQYVSFSPSNYKENKLRSIQLGSNQFTMFDSTACEITT